MKGHWEICFTTQSAIAKSGVVMGLLKKSENRERIRGWLSRGQVAHSALSFGIHFLESWGENSEILWTHGNTIEVHKPFYIRSLLQEYILVYNLHLQGKLIVVHWHLYFNLICQYNICVHLAS